MKKSLFLALMASVALFACQKNDLADALFTPVVLHGELEEPVLTKTIIGSDNHILWSEGDQIVAYLKSSYGYRYQVESSFVGMTYADFSMVPPSAGQAPGEGDEWEHNVAFYPYSFSSGCVKSSGNYVLDISLPSEQAYVSGSFADGSFPMVAVGSENDISFYNVCGGMKLQLKGTQKVVSIQIEGKNSEKLSGDATVTAYADPEMKPAITMDSSASTSVTLNCGPEGVQLDEALATEFIIVLPPVTFDKGFTVTAKDVEGETFVIEADNSNVVLRSGILVMPEVVLGEEKPKGVDYVDEYGINHGPGVEIDGVIWAPVNCGYHATDYPYGKLYQWGRKYGQGYRGYLFDDNGYIVGTHVDATTFTVKDGDVTVEVGNDESNSNVFFRAGYNTWADWAKPSNNKLWNSGYISRPTKTEYDPCPPGWLVPSNDGILSNLIKNKSPWTTNDAGQNGYYFSGSKEYSATVPQVFFPAAGQIDEWDCMAELRGRGGAYWSSRVMHDPFCMNFGSNSATINTYSRSIGCSVRCIQQQEIQD